MRAGEKTRQTELVSAALLVDRGLLRFPANSEGEGQMRRNAIGILHVGGENGLAGVVGELVSVREAARLAEEHIGQGVAAGRTAEGPLTIGLLIVEGVELRL